MTGIYQGAEDVATAGRRGRVHFSFGRRGPVRVNYQFAGQFMYQLRTLCVRS